MSRERELRLGIPLQKVLPQGSLVGDRDSGAAGRACVAGKGPGPISVHSKNLGDQIRYQRPQDGDQSGLVPGADPVGLEPDLAVGAIGVPHVMDDCVRPGSVVSPLARRSDKQVEVSA